MNTDELKGIIKNSIREVFAEMGIQKMEAGGKVFTIPWSERKDWMLQKVELPDEGEENPQPPQPNNEPRNTEDPFAEDVDRLHSYSDFRGDNIPYWRV